jgi:hypothetical protein
VGFTATSIKNHASNIKNPFAIRKFELQEKTRHEIETGNRRKLVATLYG